MMKPILDRVIIKQDEAKERKVGGIIVNVQKQESPRGTIIAIGTEVKQVQTGDIVLFNINYCQKFTTADAVEYVTICEKDILAVLPAETDVHMTKVQ